MSRSGQEFVARTEGSNRTMYAMMIMMGIPLTEEQAKFQAYLESKYPAIVEKEEDNGKDIQAEG